MEVRHDHGIGPSDHAPLPFRKGSPQSVGQGGRDHLRVEVEDVVDQAGSRELGGSVGRDHGVEVDRVDDVRPEPQETEEEVGPPPRQQEGERRLALRRTETEAVNPDAVAGLLLRIRELPIPEDHVDLESRAGQGAGLFRDTRFQACGALRTNEDDADRHVIPGTRRPVARSASRSCRRRTGSATPVSRRADVGPRRGPARGPSPRGRSIRSPRSPDAPCSRAR